MAHGDAREGEWVASTLHTTSERGVSSINTADAHTSAVSSRLNWCPRWFKWTRPFRRKTKSGFCAYAITFQTQSIFLSCGGRKNKTGRKKTPNPCALLTVTFVRQKLISLTTIRRYTTDSAFSKTELVYDLYNTIFLLYARNTVYLKRKTRYDLSKLCCSDIFQPVDLFSVLVL